MSDFYNPNNEEDFSGVSTATNAVPISEVLAGKKLLQRKRPNWQQHLY